MAAQFQGASSGSKEALNSMINQFQSKLKSNETVLSSNRKQISSLQEKNASLRKENDSLKEIISSLRKEMGHLKITHGKERHDQGDYVLNTKAMSAYPGGQHKFGNSELSPVSSSPDVTVHCGGGSVPGRIRDHGPFCAEIFEGKLSQDSDVKKWFQDLASTIGEKLAQLGEVQSRETNLKLQIENWQVTSRHLLRFFVLLQRIVINSGKGDGTTVPAWLDVALENESNRSFRKQVCKMWRLLQWNIHHSLNNSRKHSAKSQVKIDEWFDQQMDMLNVPDDMELAVANLLKSMSRDFGVVEEQVVEGLSMSIPMEPEELSSGISSSDSSLSSAIPAEDLWKFKSLLQSLVEKIDSLYQNLGKSGDLDGLDDMERDMYLPQREALENYDLGNMLRLMSHVIQSLSQEVISINAERSHCQGCGQDINIEAKGDRINDPVIHNQRTQGQLPTGFNSAGSSNGLKSRESAGQIPGSRLPLNPNFKTVSGGAVPKMPVAIRPGQGRFHGIRGPLPPSQLTVIQNSNPHNRSKSDTGISLSPQQRKVTDQSLLSKPGSLDSVFKPRSSPLDIGTSPPPGIYKHQSGEHLSDDDDDFQVRGPPDTPPEVRSFERMKMGKDSNVYSPESSGRMDKLGAFSKYAMQSASQPGNDGALYDGSLPLSQVQQCTGDNSGTMQDMLLPSSVQWSTVQLKDGGMASPTLGARSRLNTAQQRSQHVNSFSAIPQDSLLNTYSEDIETDGLDTLTNVPNVSPEGVRDPCPVCKMIFPDYVPMQAVQSHINLHFDEGPGSFEVVTENYNSLNK